MKKIILIVCLLIITGCEVEYTINLDTKINESLELTYDPLIEYTPWYYPAHNDDFGSSDINAKIEGVEYYDIYQTPGYVKYSYDFDVLNYYKSNFINYCYNVVDVKENYGNIEIQTNNKFMCFDKYQDLSYVTINVEGNNILESNADIKEANVHTWIITENSKYDADIYVKIEYENPEKEDPSEPEEDDKTDEDNKETNVTSPETNSSSNLIFVIIPLSTILIIVIVIIVKKKYS